MGKLIILMEATGYRWKCPECESMNVSPVVSSPQQCGACKGVFENVQPKHSFGKRMDIVTQPGLDEDILTF